MNWNISKLLLWATDYLQKKGVPSPRLDAELLLGRSLDLQRVQLYVQFDRPLMDSELSGFKTLLQRRAAREPLAYILGEKEFYSLKFRVGPQVLIPRPETEEIVEMGIAHCRGGSELPILDLATGSGCILIALLKQCPHLLGWGVDFQVGALALGSENAKLHGVEERARWIECDLSRDWAELPGPYQLITANLPYVSASDWEGLESEVRDYEPKSALVPGESGAESFGWTLPNIPDRLAPGGLAILEIGMEQGPLLLELAAAHCPSLKAETRRDYSGRWRFLLLKKPA